MITKTKAGSNSFEMSNGTNLDLNVTNEDEFNNLVGGFNKALSAIGDGYRAEAKTLGDRKRTSLYADLGAALAVCEVLLDPTNADWLFKLLDERDIPIVTDPETGNVYIMCLRLLMGWWPQATKNNPDPNFTWSRSVELYGKVLRGAVTLGIKPADLAAELIKARGFKKFKDADDKRYLAKDEDEKKRQDRYKKVINDDPKGIVPLPSDSPLGVTAKERTARAFVSLLCRVSSDGQQLEVICRLPDKHETLDKRIYDIAPKLVPEIDARRAEKAEARAEAAEAKLREKVGEVADKASALLQGGASSDAA